MTTDGSRAGLVYINCYQPEKQVKYDKEALILHEGVPGHHLQIALQSEIEVLPEFRKSSRFSALSEGWGLYPESLGAELGLYRDPYSRYGRLSEERFRRALGDQHRAARHGLEPCPGDRLLPHPYR